MIRTLRKIRGRLLAEGNSSKYFRYALGEMVLVIAGILIALQLNTMSQKRTEQNNVAGYARAMIQDLKADQAMLEPILLEMEGVRDRVVRLGQYVQGQPIEEMSNVDLFFLMRSPYYRPYIWNRVVLEQMQSSGALRQMENREVAAKISAYDAFQRHLDDDYAHDREIAVRALALANRVVNMNYPSMEDLVPTTTLKLGMPFFDWEVSEASEMYTTFAALDLAMIQRDPVLLGEAVNAYHQIVDTYGLWPRFRVEMPKLLAEISELIDALETEYPE